MSLDSKVLRLPERGIIGISGFGGSGKSTLARQLAEHLTAPVVSIDAFWLPERDVLGEDWPCFERERLAREVLVPWRAGREARYRVSDDRERDHGGWRIVPPGKRLIVEGCSLFHPNLLPLLDYTIWLEMPLELATARGIARDSAQFGVDMTAHWRARWEPNEQAFLERFRPDAAADIRLTLDTEP
jgi:uridine kinase